MKWWKKLADYSFCYIVAWLLILLSPLWLPVWLAKRVYNKPKEWRTTQWVIKGGDNEL